MNLRKAQSLVSDPTGRKEFQYYVELSKKAKELLDCIEAVPGRRSLLIMIKNGDTYTYTWNGCAHAFDCVYIHNNKKQFDAYRKAEAINYITVDLYQQAEWKLI